MENVKDVDNKATKQTETKPTAAKVQSKNLKDQENADIANDNALLDEVLRGYRILYLSEKNFIKKLFDVDSIRIYDKSILKVSKYGDQEFTQERNRLIMSGDYLTQSEQMEYLKKRGVWSDEHETRMRNMRKEVDEMILERDKLFEQAEQAEKNNKKKILKDTKANIDALGDRMFKLHEELMELTATSITYFRDTIEMRAQMRQHMGWIVSAVCRNEGEDKYSIDGMLWKNVEEIEDDLKDHDFTLILNECASFWNSSDSESESFFAESPEELIPDSAGELQKK